MLLWPFNKYPGTDYETFNWEWILKMVKDYTEKVDDFTENMTNAWDTFKNIINHEIAEMHRKFAIYVNVTEEALNTGAIADGAVTFEKLAAGLLPYVRPEDYGAAGDGVTDDYTALTAAFNNADGYPVWLAAGKTYLTSGTIDINVPMFNQGEIKYTGSGIALNFKPTQNVDGMNWNLGTIRGEDSNVLIMLDSTDAWMQYLNFDFDMLIGNTNNPVFYLKVVGTHWINEVRFNKGKFAAGMYAVYFDDSLKTGTNYNSGYVFNKIGFEGVTYGLHLVDRITGIVFNACRCRESITAILEGGANQHSSYQSIDWIGHPITWQYLGNPINYAINISGGFVDKSGNLRNGNIITIYNGSVYGLTWHEGMRENVNSYSAYSVDNNIQTIDTSIITNYNTANALGNARPFVRTFTSPNDVNADGYEIKLDDTLFSNYPELTPNNTYLFNLTVSPGKYVKFTKMDGTVLYTYTNTGSTTVYPYFEISKAFNYYAIEDSTNKHFHT